MAKLTNKQRRFVDEYLVDLNAKQAAIRAGYSPQTAEQTASRLLSIVKVEAAILRSMAERSKRTGVTADRVIIELAKIAFANITDVANIDEATIRDETNKDDTAAILSVKARRITTKNGDIIEREIKMYDKVRALIELGKHVGLFDSKVKIDGILPVIIRDDLGDDDD